MGNNKNLKEDSKGTRFSTTNQPKNNGRKPSIKKQLSELLLKNGQIKIDAKQVISINEDGSVIIKLPTEMQLAMKLKQLAMSGKNNTTLGALKVIMEQVDGKPKQETALTGAGGVPLMPHTWNVIDAKKK